MRPRASSARREALDALVAARPDHPYALRRRASGVAEAVEWFAARVAEGRSRRYALHRRRWSENLLLPTAVGVPRPSALVPETMAAGDLRGGARDLRRRLPRDEGLPPGAARRQPRARGRACGARGRARPRPEGRADVNALGFARAFDDPSFRARRRAARRAQAGRRRAARASPPCSGSPTRMGSGRSSSTARAAGLRDPDAAAVGAGHARLRDAARALRRAGGRVILNAVVGGAERVGRRA